MAIAGPNGGGKTTLVRLALGLDRPNRGEVRLFGEPARRSRVAARRSATSPSARNSDSTRRRRYGRSSRLGDSPRAGLLGRLGREDREHVTGAIARVGLTAEADRPLARLSGGQQQRAFVAKALASEPELLVLDEPTTGVDVEAQEELGVLLAELNAGSA